MKIFLKQLTMSTQDISTSDILSFMKSLSEKFHVLKEKVENLKKPNHDKENFTS